MEYLEASWAQMIGQSAPTAMILITFVAHPAKVRDFARIEGIKGHIAYQRFAQIIPPRHSGHKQGINSP